MSEISLIPIRNLYALLAYAWDCLDVAPPTGAGMESVVTPADLLAWWVSDGMARILRRGIHRAYVERDDELRLVRGRVDVDASVKRATLVRGVVACAFDELTPDTHVNRAIKATMRRLLSSRQIDPRIGGRLRRSFELLGEVSDVAATDALMIGARGPRGRADYAVVLDACRLVHENLRATEDGERYKLRDFTRDRRKMARVFETFVRSFLKRELGARAKVGRPHVKWADLTGDASDVAWLPGMETDVSVESAEARTIIETKFYEKPFEARREGGREKVPSKHVYQLFAYLKNLEAIEPRRLSGVLLYARVGKDVRATFRLGKLEVSIRTLDLSLPWEELRRSLLELTHDHTHLAHAAPHIPPR